MKKKKKSVEKKKTPTMSAAYVPKCMKKTKPKKDGKVLKKHMKKKKKGIKG